MRECFVLIGLLLLSCGGDSIPEEIIAKDKMPDVLYDLALLSQYRNYGFDVIKKDSMLSLQKVLLDKHGIDSLQLAKSIEYYSEHPKMFSPVYKEVLRRLSQKEEEYSKTVNDSPPQIKKESLNRKP